MEGKTKFRGLKSTGGCSGSGSFVVEVRDRADNSERDRARKAEEARQREEAIEAKYKPWADYVASLSGDIRECMLEGNHLLIENTRVYDDIMPLMRAVAELEIDGAMTNGGQMLGYFVESCETFISTERQWTGQSWGDPPAEVSCISPPSARCTPFYVVETDTASQGDPEMRSRRTSMINVGIQRSRRRPNRLSNVVNGIHWLTEVVLGLPRQKQNKIEEAEREKERQRIVAEKEKEGKRARSTKETRRGATQTRRKNERDCMS